MSDSIVFKKTFQTGPGVFQVDHVPIGIRYVGSAKDPLKEAQRILELIATNKSPYRGLNQRHKIDPEWDLLVHHTKTVADAKRTAKVYVDTLSSTLVANIKDYKKGKSNDTRKTKT